MKLWLCTAISTDYDPTGLCVAETEENAIVKFSKYLDNQCIWYTSVCADEINEVDGYGIALIENIGKISKKY
jgi:hypothetical protein